MSLLRYLAPIAALALAISGCAGPPNRNAVLDTLNPAPMSPQAWSRVVGTYNGPIRATTIRYGFEAQAAMETRLDISGTPDAPLIIFKTNSGYSTSWSQYDERRATYTNIPSERYGSQGTVTASTHAPNQMLITLRRDTTLTHKGIWMILTFTGDGKVDVDWIGHSGWRGNGELWRVPNLAASQ